MCDNAREHFDPKATNAPEGQNHKAVKPPVPTAESQSEYMARLEDENIAKGLIPGMPS